MKKTMNINGIPIFIPNSTIQADGFYISYNSYDKDIYGCDTTALVNNDMTKFLILNGNHMEEYKKLLRYGYDKCMEYFLKHQDLVNNYSDKG